MNAGEGNADHVRLAGAAVIVLLFLAPCRAKAQAIPQQQPDAIERIASIEKWMQAGAYAEAKQEAIDALSFNRSIKLRADLIDLIVRASLDGEEYEDAYQWSRTFIATVSNDRRRTGMWFAAGIGAYHTGRIDSAIVSLNVFLDFASGDPRRNEALYWRGMAETEEGEWPLAEADFRQAYEDTSALARRDDALLAWALALERRGDLAQAMRHLQQLITEFPDSRLLADAKIRMASLSLRQNDPAHAASLLAGVRPRYESQREESQLLLAESHLKTGYTSAASNEFAEFLRRYGSSPYARKARFGLAWALMKNGETDAARRQFDSLGSGADTLSLGALFQSGVLALLENKPVDAATAFQTLTDRSPYDIYSDEAEYQLGMIDYRSKHYREAKKHFEIVTRLFPESDKLFVAFRMLGETCLAIGDFSNAQYAFSLLVKLKAPDSLLAPALFQKGVALYHLGAFKSSAECLGDFLGRFPDNERAPLGYLWRAEALYQDGRYPEAENAYRDALPHVHDEQKRAEVMYGIAWTEFEQKKFAEAAKAFGDFTTTFPANDRALDAALRRADCYFFMKEYDKAQALYGALASEKTKNTEYAAFQLAMSFVSRGETQRGIDQLRSFLATYPNSMYCEVVQFNIAWTYYSTEQYPQAIVELRTQLAKYPQSQLLPRVLFNLGDSYYNTKVYDSARAYYQHVLDEFPQSALAAEALNGLRYTYQAQGRSDEALTTIDKYLAVKRDTAFEQDLLSSKADLLFGQGDLAGAAQEYRRLIVAAKDSGAAARALLQLGHIAELQHDTATAVDDYRNLLATYPRSESAPRAALALGIVSTAMRKFDDAATALADFDKRFAGSPLIAEAQYRYGLALAALKDNDKARDEFSLVIAQHPTDVFADRSSMELARLLQDEKHYQAAIDTLNAVVNRRNDDIAAEALLMMGDVYMAYRKPIDALSAYKDVVDQYTDFPVLIERGHLGEGSAYEALRNRSHARTEYEAVMKSDLDPVIHADVENRLKRLKK